MYLTRRQKLILAESFYENKSSNSHQSGDKMNGVCSPWMKLRSAERGAVAPAGLL